MWFIAIVYNCGLIRTKALALQDWTIMLSRAFVERCGHCFVSTVTQCPRPFYRCLFNRSWKDTLSILDIFFRNFILFLIFDCALHCVYTSSSFICSLVHREVAASMLEITQIVFNMFFLAILLIFTNVEKDGDYVNDIFY